MEEKKVYQNIMIPFFPVFMGILMLFIVSTIALQWIKLGNDLKITSGEKEKLTISAEGKIDAIPDIAELSLSVITEGVDEKKAKNENAVQINAVLAYLESMGIEKKDIQTQGIQVSPKYDWTDGKTTINGYTMTQNLIVTIRALDKAGEIVAGAVDKGANEVGQLQYDFSDSEGLKQQARQLALGNARTKAEELAKTAGITLGKLITFSEQNVSSPVIANYRAFEMASDVKSTVSAPITPGTSEVIATISVTYEIN
jgi:uncharacterized protein YggE